MFTPLRQRENELLYKLAYGALQVVTHTLPGLEPVRTAVLTVQRQDDWLEPLFAVPIKGIMTAYNGAFSCLFMKG